MGREGHPVRAVVTGAGGFIGHHLVKRLKAEGAYVIGIDVKYPEFEESAADEFAFHDLRDTWNWPVLFEEDMEVYNLAADMGGIGYITSTFADLAADNALININVLKACRDARVGRALFSSSACVYPSFKQHDADVTPLKESDAIPADPEKGYGWEKLFSEQLFQYYAEDYGLKTRIARFHNVYGPLGTYEGGREKAPAALCRKIAMARSGDEIEVWGDGEQTRSFLYVDDCVDGIIRLMRSDYDRPLNIGSDRMVTINELIDIIAGVADKTIYRKHDLTKPQGVRGRNSDNSLCEEVLGWKPKVSLEEGIERTYRWIEERVS